MGVVDKPPVYSATYAFGGQQGTMGKQPAIALAGPTQLALQTLELLASCKAVAAEESWSRSALARAMAA